MKAIENIKFDSKDKLYKFINIKLIGLISDEDDWLSSLCNASALLWLLLEDINWAGFYFMKDGKLVLGPFQGKPACVNIEVGKGVCGTCAATKEIQIVKNVHEFPGHIACDGASNSEIVLPIIVNGEVMGVLDIDSPNLNRFDEEDGIGLEKIINTIIKYIDFNQVLRR